MKKLKFIVAALSITTATLGSAWADVSGGHGHHSGYSDHGGHGYYGGHHHDHIFWDIGIGPFWGPGYYYGPPAYYYQTPVVVQSPPVYMEQTRSPVSATENYWYYCDSSRRYYPYVKECPGGWHKVSPTPPDEQ